MMKTLSVSLILLILAFKQGNSYNAKGSNNMIIPDTGTITLPLYKDTTIAGDWQATITEHYPESQLKMITTVFWQFNGNNTGNEILSIKSISTATNASTTFTINFPFTWKTFLFNSKEKLKLKYGLGELIAPSPAMINENEKTPSIKFAKSLIQDQSNKTIESEYSIKLDLLVIKNNPNSNGILRFNLLPPTSICDISTLRNRKENESSDKLLEIFFLWKYHKIMITKYEKSSEQFGQKIRYYLDKNQKQYAIAEIDNMIEQIKRGNQTFLGNSKVPELERLQELIYCYYLNSLKTYSDLKVILKKDESSKNIFENIITYLKARTSEDNKMMLSIRTELIRLDEIYELSTIEINN